MTIAWIDVTPLSSLLGGGLIGCAAALLLLFIGRIAGISGILGGLLGGLWGGSLKSASGDRAWRVAFISGLLAAPWAYGLVSQLPASVIDASAPVLIVAGLLVGVGTRYAGGCTSGHGVCGLSRLSLRSLAATGSFMALGFATVAIARHGT